MACSSVYFRNYFAGLTYKSLFKYRLFLLAVLLYFMASPVPAVAGHLCILNDIEQNKPVEINRIFG